MKGLKLYNGIALVLLMFYLIAQYNQPKPVNWEPSFSRKHKIPFGTYVLYNRLNDLFPKAIITPKRSAPYVTLDESAFKPGCYLLIAQQVKLDEYDFKALRNYMLKGNTVFIASFNVSDFLSDSLKLDISSENKFKVESAIPVSFVNRRLKPAKKYVFNKGIGDQYFSRFDTARAEILGVNNKGHANFIRYRYGKGGLYLMASPLFFSNYNLLKRDGAEYAAKALSYLPVKSEVIWDEFSALGAEGEESPLRVIFDYQPIRWAYFITLFSLIAFVLYELKRRQRIIPIMAPLQNSSAEFVKVVGQVYYQQRNNLNIAEKKATYLLEDIRSKYHLKTTVLDGEFSELLIAKSGADSDLVKQLLVQLALIRQAKKVSDNDLIALNKNIEQFYKQSN